MIKFLVPIYYSGEKQVCTTITSSYHMISQATVQLAYGNHSKPSIIEIWKRDEKKDFRIPEMRR